MFSFRKLYGYIFLLSLFPVQILNCEVFKSADELACALLFALAGIDFYVHGIDSVRRYKFLCLVVAIMTFYAVYSVLFCHFNTIPAIISDFISQIKPFAAFGVTMALGVTIDGEAKAWLRIAALVNTLFLILTCIFWLPDYSIFGQPSNFGGIMLLSALSYLYGSLDHNELREKDKWIVIMMLVIGLFCTRSKYYGEFLFMLFLVFAYKPGMQRHLSLKRLLVFSAVIVLVLLVAWNKIHYYFIEGSNDVFDAAADDTSLAENFARPVLYAVAGLLFLDFFPFGTGLASYASFASADSYSTLYYDYGVNMVHGLSPDYPSFICDAYYPTLAQFGITGVFLFLGFWYWIVRRLNSLEKERGESFKYQYIIGVMVVAFVFIECIASTFFIQGHGMFAMMLLAIVINERNNSYGKC